MDGDGIERNAPGVQFKSRKPALSDRRSVVTRMIATRYACPPRYNASVVPIGIQTTRQYVSELL